MNNDNWIERLLMLGIGTTSLAAEKMREVTDQWVKEGRIDPKHAQEFVNELTERMRSESGNWEENMERQMRNILQDLGVPQQREMDELRGRLDRLERQVRDIENKLWR
ncbi:hypothetical protein KR51_00030030 [Rubidibacter lacunae KORDI 51-2]|uniref:Polyhydroxyalkanoate synthesis regulator phasin n=1 Tax=Rubidibacter lacunae KORDI 51-2 TaxID=582515 RepID=U5DGR1_9CHRO|nr:phasin family protein [Rubidibacter lacunae]ERN40462.1 hypothetical protein KR51_00030030 [Rubidibacter lacunae KORDI 51-2]